MLPIRDNISRISHVPRRWPALTDRGRNPAGRHTADRLEGLVPAESASAARPSHVGPPRPALLLPPPHLPRPHPRLGLQLSPKPQHHQGGTKPIGGTSIRRG